MITTTLPIESPEGITFTYDLANIVDRGKAYLVDLVFRALIVLVFAILLLTLVGPVANAGVGLWIILLFITEWGYYVLCEATMDGQSVGKRLLSLRVVAVTGRPISFYESVTRNLLRAVDSLPLTYGVGLIAIFLTHRFQRLGDLAAGTIVVQERQKAFHQHLLKPFEVLAPAHHLAVNLSHRERALLQDFILRKDRLHPERCEQLAEILAVHYQKQAPFLAAESATEFLEKLLAANMGARKR